MSAYSNSTGLFTVESTGQLTTAGYCYDAGTLSWIPQVAASAGAGPSSNVTVLNASLATTQAGAWTVGVNNFPSTLAVTGTFYQATQPVSLASTTITGTVAATQSGTWNIGSVTTLPALVAGSAVIGSVKLTDGTSTATIGNLTNNKALATMIVDATGTQITSFGGGTQYAAGTTQATPTGTVAMGKNASNVLSALALDASGNLNVNLAAGSITGGNAAASATGAAVPASADYVSWNSGGNNTGVSLTTALPVQPGTGAMFSIVDPDTTASASLTAAAQAATLTLQGGCGTAMVQMTGTFVATVQFEGTVDGTNWFSVNGALQPGGALVTSATAVGQWALDIAGLNQFRVRCSAYTSGTAVVSIRGSAASALVALDSPLPTGSNTIGVVAVNGTVVTGTISGTTSVAAFSAGAGHMVFYKSGTFTGTLITEASVDGTNWVTVSDLNNSTTGGGATNALYTSGVGAFSAGGWQYIRVRCSAYTSGTLTVTWVTALAPWVGALTLSSGSPTAPANITMTNGSALLNGGWAGGQGIGGLHAAGTAIASTGNPVRIGGLAKTANPTAVTDGQVSNLMTDKMGRMVVVQGHVRNLVGTQATTLTSAVGANTVVTAGAAGVFNDITSITISNSSATASVVTLSDGTASYNYNCVAGGVVTIPFNPPLPATTAAVAWTLTCGTSVASIYVAIVYVKNL